MSELKDDTLYAYAAGQFLFSLEYSLFCILSVRRLSLHYDGKLGKNCVIVR